MSMTTTGVPSQSANTTQITQAVNLSEPANYFFPKQFPMYQIAKGTVITPQEIKIIEEGYYFNDPKLAREYFTSQKSRGVESLVIILLDSWETGGVISLKDIR